MDTLPIEQVVEKTALDLGITEAAVKRALEFFNYSTGRYNTKEVKTFSEQTALRAPEIVAAYQKNYADLPDKTRNEIESKLSLAKIGNLFTSW